MNYPILGLKGYSPKMCVTNSHKVMKHGRSQFIHVKNIDCGLRCQRLLLLSKNDLFTEVLYLCQRCGPKLEHK